MISLDQAMQILHSVPLWEGQEITAEPVTGGLTNFNYKVVCAGKSYFARLTTDRTAVGIDRRNEVACQNAAAGLGVAPSVLYVGDGVIVSEYIRGMTLDETCRDDPALMVRVAQKMRAFHDAGTGHIADELLYFCPFAATRTYIRRARELGAAMPADTDAILSWLGDWERRCTRYRPTLVHGDLVYKNLVRDAADKIWIVDWEYGGIGVYPMFDPAWLAAALFMDEAQSKNFLGAWLGRAPMEQDIEEFNMFRALGCLRDGFSALIQDKTSEPIIDYKAHAAEYLGHYRSQAG